MLQLRTSLRRVLISWNFSNLPKPPILPRCTAPAESPERDYDFLHWRKQTCTPSKDTPVEEIPLTIGGHPVVIPVEYRYPASAFTMPPPDPHPHFIDPSIEIDEDTVNDIFEIFEDVLGFYLLINGMLQLIVPDDFDFQYALSHRRNEFGGARTSYIPEAMIPTAERREDRSSSTTFEQPLPIVPSETRQRNDMNQPASSSQPPIQPHTTSSSGATSTRRPGHCEGTIM
ncbi:hypothetical protein EDB80DRAFT_691770 [Ilyonectria destructans]|nr:hypothetical protein EDB80DRAFT_691770 [Ilyonectria destructans]